VMKIGRTRLFESGGRQNVKTRIFCKGLICLFIVSEQNTDCNVTFLEQSAMILKLVSYGRLKNHVLCSCVVRPTVDSFVFVSKLLRVTCWKLLYRHPKGTRRFHSAIPCCLSQSQSSARPAICPI
jgi:hypothetical protein